MPAAQSQADLLAITEKEWAKLAKLIATLTEAQALAADAEGDCVKDILAHRTHWIGLFFQWLAEGAAAEMPDHGVKWNQLKPYNARIKAAAADRPWADVQADLTAAHGRLLRYIAAQDDTALYGGPMPGGNGWTTGRYAEASGASHYRSAAKFIRARKRALANA